MTEPENKDSFGWPPAVLGSVFFICVTAVFLALILS